ncbi:ABC transporter permease [Kitasatospora paracochleata]|uniref:NitT/TauT family transport system permease protein n=1 Tax=Kitasatospora paracochleata TaxID=58354 RepID=A0ABT1J618_9ACTN|nr:ABC transporter permease [Kitasatospora paracochleata]MCP2312568.1 NitT/TauT family transport system permease protein [Kitasatospora paracochleata]
MSSSPDTTTLVEDQPQAPADTAADGTTTDSASVEAGLDALETVHAQRIPVGQVLRQKALPPLLGVLLVLALWQTAYSLHLTSSYKLPSPADVWNSLQDLWYQGTLFSIIWTSVWRGLSGFALSVVIGTPIGLVVAQVKPIRAAVGPVLSGLQSLPSVAWVPAAVIWLGINDQAMYAVILLGAVPSIANGLISGVDQVPPLYLRAGKTLGATGLRGARHVLLPAALPGYLAGLKQGWAFSWRSLMAAELIASSPDLGLGLGRYLENQREFSDMSGVLLGILLILFVGVAIDLLFFSPLERRVLRSRGLLVTSR